MKLKLFAFITYAIFNFTNTTNFPVDEPFKEQSKALKCFSFTVILRAPNTNGTINLSQYHFDNMSDANGFATSAILLGYTPTLQWNNCGSKQPTLFV